MATYYEHAALLTFLCPLVVIFLPPKFFYILSESSMNHFQSTEYLPENQNFEEN